jgi:lipid-A-disaccharide synthase
VTRLYLIAGEASGDVLGGRLIAALRARDPSIGFAGIGGERMAEQGFASLFPIDELALMGLLEVLPSLRRLARRLDQTVDDIATRKPDLVVTIDSPGFTLRVAERVKKRLGIPVVHYVAPQVWAWRPGRVKTLARQVDRILALLPFEPPFFEAAGIPVDFVGHPVLENPPGDPSRLAVPPGLRPLLVMPGSRMGEVRRLLPIFAETVQRLPPDLLPVIALAGPVEAAVREAVRGWPRPPLLLRDAAAKRDAMAGAAVGLIKSGTSSLECVAAGLPHVVGYRANPITAEIVRALIKVEHVSLVNLLLRRAIVPEFLQQRCTPEALARALGEVLAEPEAQKRGFAEALAMLAPAEGMPSEAAAAAVLRSLR